MFEAITIPNEEGVFSPPDGIKLAGHGYLKLPNGKLYNYRISTVEPVFIFIEVHENEIFIDEEILPMVSVPFVEFQGKKYIREDKKPFQTCEDYRFPDRKTYFCLRLEPVVSFLSNFDNWPTPLVFGHGFKPVYTVIEVS
jgi:hypothetical protein